MHNLVCPLLCLHLIASASGLFCSPQEGSSVTQTHFMCISLIHLPFILSSQMLDTQCPISDGSDTVAPVHSGKQTGALYWCLWRKFRKLISWCKMWHPIGLAIRVTLLKFWRPFLGCLFASKIWSKVLALAFKALHDLGPTELKGNLSRHVSTWQIHSSQLILETFPFFWESQSEEVGLLAIGW